MVDSDPQDDNTLYQCGACTQSRRRENVDFVPHSEERLGEFPICSDKPCSIDDVQAPGESSASTYRVEGELE